MDYDQRIKQLEDEVRHEREMRLIHATHLSALDSSNAYIREMLADTVKVVKDTAVNLYKLELEVSNLVRAITKDHSNGQEPPLTK